jgi:hypothetical protein
LNSYYFETIYKACRARFRLPDRHNNQPLLVILALYYFANPVITSSEASISPILVIEFRERPNTAAIR